MRAVRVHLHDHAVTALEGPAEPGDVCLAQARLLRPVHDLDVRIGLGQLVRDVAGAVRAVVVHDQQVGLGQRGPDPAGDRFQVLPLVVSRHDDDGLADRRVGGWMWLCHYPCLSLRKVNRRCHDGARHDIPVLAFPCGTPRAPARPVPMGQRAGARICAWPSVPAYRRGNGAEQLGKGPGQRLRTGVRPVGNGLGLRCLLGARAPSTPNPPSSRTRRPSAPFQCHAWPRSR